MHAVLKDFIQWDSLQKDRNVQGKLMRFRFSENNSSAYHNHCYTGNVLTHCKQGRIYNVHLSSFLDYHLFRNTKCILRKSFLSVIMIIMVVSHLFTQEIFAVQCAIWTKIVFAHISHKKKKTALLNDNRCDLTQENVHYALTVNRIKAFIICLLSACNLFKCFMKTVSSPRQSI